MASLYIITSNRSNKVSFLSKFLGAFADASKLSPTSVYYNPPQRIGRPIFCAVFVFGEDGVSLHFVIISNTLCHWFPTKHTLPAPLFFENLKLQIRSTDLKRTNTLGVFFFSSSLPYFQINWWSYSRALSELGDSIYILWALGHIFAVIISAYCCCVLIKKVLGCPNLLSSTDN